MKGFGGFGDSPAKQKGFIRTPDDFDHAEARKDAKKRVADQKARDLKSKMPKNFNTVGSSEAGEFAKVSKKPTSTLSKLKKVAKRMAKKIGPIGTVLTAYEVAKTIPKVSKATIKGLKQRTKKETKTGYKNPGVRKI